MLYLRGEEEEAPLSPGDDRSDDRYRLYVDTESTGPSAGELGALKGTMNEARPRPRQVARGPSRKTPAWLSDGAAGHDVDVELARRLSGEPMGAGTAGHTAIHERIVSDHRIQELAHAMVRHRLKGLLRSGDGVPRPVTVVAYDVERRRLGWELEAAEEAPAAPFVIDVAGYNSIFRFLVESTAPGGKGSFSAPLPQEVVRWRRRWRRRGRVPSAVRVRVRVIGRDTPTLEGPLNDLSVDGLSFESEPEREVLDTESELELDVERPGAPPIRLRGVVRHISGPWPGRPGICGVRLRDCEPGELQRWTAWVESVLYPTTSRASGWSEAVWRLHERAGYFALSGKDPGQFETLRTAFHVVSAKLEAAPHLGCQVAWPLQDREALATLSVLRLYRGTWFAYQLAKIKGNAPDGTRGAAVLRDIHLHAYEHVQNDSELRWLVSYTQVKRVWSRLVYHDLPRRYIESGLASIVRFRALEVDALAPSAGPSPPEVTVGAPDAAELADGLRILAHRLPRPYYDALDFAPEAFSLESDKRHWQAAGLLRDRQALVARVEGTPVALAILEVAEGGLHLFRLLDSIRLYALAPNGERGFVPLLEAAKSWYLSHRKPSFTCLIDLDEAVRPESLSGLTDLGMADMNVLSAELLPEMLEHLCEHTAPPALIERHPRTSDPGARSMSPAGTT